MKHILSSFIVGALAALGGCAEKVEVETLLHKKVPSIEKSDVESACKFAAEQDGRLGAGLVWEHFRSYSWSNDPEVENGVIFRRDWYGDMPIVEFEKVLNENGETLVYKDKLPDYPTVTCTATYDEQTRTLHFTGLK